MAPKKQNPIEIPRAAATSTSEEEEEDNSSEELTSSDDQREEDTEQPIKPSSPPPRQTQKQLAVKKPEITPPTSRAKSTRSEDSESDSESDSEPDATPKPMEETPKVTKPRSKPVSKRSNESEDAAKDSKSKRAKKKGPEEEEQKRPGEDTKKQLFQRLWSESDEIAILKGMIEYWAKKGVDPNQDAHSFYDYIKKSLSVEVNRNQLVVKMRRLKKKYDNNLRRGINPTFSKAHEQKSFDLSKNLWGSENSVRVIESAAKSNGKGKKNQNQKDKGAALDAELIDGPDIDNDVHKKRNSKEKVVLFDRSVGVAGLEESVVNDGLVIIGEAKKEELEARWKKLQVTQLELFMQRNELVKDQAKLVLDAIKSSSD